MNENSKVKRIVAGKIVAMYEKAQALRPKTDEKVTVTRPAHPEETKKIRCLV